MNTGSHARLMVQAAVFCGLAMFSRFAGAVEFQLDTPDPYPNSDGHCALIEAIDNANADAVVHADCPAGDGADLITLGAAIAVDGRLLFPPSLPIFFDSGESGLPEIASDITLRRGELVRTGDLAFRFFVVQPAGILRLEDIVLSNGLVNGHCGSVSNQGFVGCGGAIVVNQGELHLTRALFSQNRALQSQQADLPIGGGIWVSAGTLNIEGSQFIGNQADLGGAIAAQRVKGTILDSIFQTNSASLSGGAIYQSFNGEIVISDTTFDSNTVTGSGAANFGGGAIDNAGSSSQLTVINSLFIKNSAPRGGALNNFNASSSQLTNCTFSGNVADFGGAIRNEGSGATLNIHAGTLSENTAFQGAGIHNGGSQAGIAHVYDTVIVGNTATSNGGGILSTGRLDIVNSRLIDNSGSKGGAVFIGSATNQSVSIDSSTLRGNFASQDGGGLYFTANPSSIPNTLTVSASTFDNNEADQGGGIYAEVVDITVTGSTFSNNVASSIGVGGGGGIHIRSFVVTGALVDISNTTMSGNHAAQDGGGVYLSGSAIDALISNSTIAGNTAGSTGGGDGLHSLTSLDRLTVKDSILADNGNRNCYRTDSTGFTDGGTNISSDGTCSFADAGGGTGDDTDPLLMPLSDNDGTTRTHALNPASPAIGQGSIDCKSTDQRGAARVDGCDIGAFEAEVTAPSLTLSVDQETLLEEEETVATISVTLDNSGESTRPVDVQVAMRVTGSASGLGIDYQLSNQVGLEANQPGRVTPLTFTLEAGAQQTQEFTIVTVDDSIFEADESIVIEFAAIGFAISEPDPELTLTIVSDDTDNRPELVFKDGFEDYP